MKDETKRLKRVEIQPEAFVHMMKAGSFDVMANALPEDARVVGAGGIISSGFDHRKNLIVIIVESETYEPYPIGEVIPLAPMTVFRNKPPDKVEGDRYTRSEAHIKDAQDRAERNERDDGMNPLERRDEISGPGRDGRYK